MQRSISFQIILWMYVRCIQSNNYRCIARADAPDDKLQELVVYLCGNENCSQIQPSGPCFNPNTVRDHASFAHNLNFRNIAACMQLEIYGNVTSLDPCKIFSSIFTLTISFFLDFYYLCMLVQLMQIAIIEVYGRLVCGDHKTSARIE